MRARQPAARAPAPGPKAGPPAAAPGGRPSPARTGPGCTPGCRETPFRLEETQREIELQRRGAQRNRAHRQSRQRDGRLGCGVLGGILEGEHHLEQRRAAGIAPRLQLLDYLLERQLLVIEGAQGDRTHPAQQIQERGAADPAVPGRLPERSSRSARVLTKKPINPSSSARLRPATGVPSDRSAWPLQRPSSAAKPASRVMNGVVPRRLRAPAEASPDPVQPDPLHRPARRQQRRPGPVGGQLQHRRAGESPLPVGHLGRQHRALQVPALPEREVGVLHRQLRQRR